MEKALSAYTDEHIQRYLENVKTNGLKEHGFPRLTANIGILMAHGRRRDLMSVFMEMMDVCCEMFLRPYIRSANEFSVREIVFCIKEIEDAKLVDAADIARWKQKISMIVPEACYDVVVKNETDRITNWAIFGAVSEYVRFHFGLGENLEFVDRQLSCQFQWLDQNDMYRDNKDSLIHQPIVYDYVSRGLFATLLHFGYRGKYYEQMDRCLKNAGLLMLTMQSPTGEVPFGGRSNQFLHNEPWQMLLFEYEARRYAAEGNMEQAAVFKSAVARSLAVTKAWLDKTPIRHIKNRFPTETKYGCEDYAYFDKYMITTASFLYLAYLFCDDSIPTVQTADHTPAVFETSYHFHKLFLKNGGYALEFDTNAHGIYDANGLGRVHREGAPSAICMSCPCPSKPIYTVDIEEPFAFSLCSAIPDGEDWRLGADTSASYRVIESGTDKNSVSAELLCTFMGGRAVKESYKVDGEGVSIAVEGIGEIGYTLPALCFDGEVSPEIVAKEHTLSVKYDGWICRYTTDGEIKDLLKMAANRNGHYRVFLAVAKGNLNVKIEIIKA